MKKPRLNKMRTSINVNKSKEGQTMEQRMSKLMEQEEPIKDKAPLIWTPKDEGVRPEFNIRTDRYDLAQEAMDMVSRSEKAKRAQMLKDDDVLPKEGGSGEE